MPPGAKTRAQFHKTLKGLNMYLPHVWVALSRFISRGAPCQGCFAGSFSPALRCALATGQSCRFAFLFSLCTPPPPAPTCLATVISAHTTNNIRGGEGTFFPLAPVANCTGYTSGCLQPKACCNEWKTTRCKKEIPQGGAHYTEMRIC